MSGATRREFLGGASALLAALGWEGCVSLPERCETLPAWQPGELDLHFIYTGCGENMFYRLPDGTAILNDVGDFYRPKDLAHVPLLPSADRPGGDWVRRYIARVYPERTIDYAILSHWHVDHGGHADFGRPEDPNGAYRYRTTSDGRKVNGLLCVAEEFRFARWFDHQYPERGTYGTQDSSMKLLSGWIEEQKGLGMKVEPFRIGAQDQIVPVRDPQAYAGRFSILNLCANGRVWDGRDGVIDYAAEHMRATKDEYMPQNALSLGFVMRYGRFGYFAAGDVRDETFTRLDGTKFNAQEHLGRLIGPVSVCKLGHHGGNDSMSTAFARSVRAQAYVGCMWCQLGCSALTMRRIDAARSAGAERPLFLPQLVTHVQREAERETGWKLPHSGAVHVVVKVAPGGDSYRVYLVDAHDESMRVVAKFDRMC